MITPLSGFSVKLGRGSRLLPSSVARVWRGSGGWDSMPPSGVVVALLGRGGWLSMPPSGFAGARLDRGGTLAALSSAAAALLVGNRGSDDANSDLIVPNMNTHMVIN